MIRRTLPLAAAVLAATTTLAWAQAPGGQGTWGGSANSPTSEGTNQGGPFRGSTTVAPDDRTGSVVIIEDGEGQLMRPDGQDLDLNSTSPTGTVGTNPNR